MSDDTANSAFGEDTSEREFLDLEGSRQAVVMVKSIVPMVIQEDPQVRTISGS